MKNVFRCEQCGCDHNPEVPVMRCRKCAHYFCDGCHEDHGCGSRFKAADAVELAKSTGSEVISATQAALVDEVKSYHAGCKASYEHQIQYAFMAGLKLNALKDSCLHGNAAGAKGKGFEALCAEFLPEISLTASARYRHFAKLVIEKNATVGFIRGSNLLLENGDLPEKEKQAVLKAVYEAADGKTWTAFYRDLDLCRQKKAAAYHPPVSTPAEKESAAREGADHLARMLLADISLIMDLKTWTLLSTDRQNEIEENRLTLGHFIKEHSPKKSAKR